MIKEVPKRRDTWRSMRRRRRRSGGRSRRSRRRVSLWWQAGATEKRVLEQDRGPATSQLP